MINNKLPQTVILMTSMIDSLLFKFSSLSQGEVHDLVRASSEKSCGLDPIPTKLLLDCLDVLLPIITKMINYSLENGDFPSAWKMLWFCLCSRKMVWNLYLKIIGLSVIYSLCPNLLKVQLLNNYIITWWQMICFQCYSLRAESFTVLKPHS